MKSTILRTLGALLLSSSLFQAAHAGSITYDAAINGLSVPGATLSATGGALVLGNKDGVVFVGVAGGGSGDEISMGQSVTVAFNAPTQLASLTLGLLFNGPEYRDHNEIAASIINSGATYELRLVGENAAKWYQNGIYLKDVAGVGTVNGGIGTFTINNPFGGTFVSTMKLTPFSSNPTGNESDFGLRGFKTIPDGGTTAAMLGAALLVMGVSCRKRFSKV